MFENPFRSGSPLEQFKKQERKREQKEHQDFMRKYEKTDAVFMRPINQDTIEQRKNEA